MEQPTWSKNMGTPLFGSWSKESTEQQWGVSHNAGPVLTGQRQTKSKPTAFGGPVPMLRQFRPAFLLRPPLSIFANQNQVNNSKQVELLPPSSEVNPAGDSFSGAPGHQQLLAGPAVQGAAELEDLHRENRLTPTWGHQKRKGTSKGKKKGGNRKALVKAPLGRHAKRFSRRRT